MMVKEFCVDYTVHESEKYTNVPECTVKTKTGDELVAKDIPEYDVSSYIKSLRDLGYKEVFYIPYYRSKVEKYADLISETQKHIKDLEKSIALYHTSLENAENKLDDVGKSSCDWWGDCWTNSGY